ncbi:MAG: SDR family NAD(P)-dependent oxidoreductase [Gemmatimonadota bacterium]
MAPSPDRLAFVTGTSSGIGEALARRLLADSWRVLGAARRAAPIRDAGYTHIQVDLADRAKLIAVLDSQVKPLLAEPALTRVGLVNNAALVALLGPMAQIDPAGMVDAYAVNTVAPVLLMGWFLRATPAGVPVRIVNVSTGAAVLPLPGLGGYGNTKAALRLAGMVLAAELDMAGSSRDATILSYEPGIVDTPMQTAVRTSSVEMLPIVQQFKDWQAGGVLIPPELPAGAIADYLEADGHPRWLEHRWEAPSPGE